MNVLYTILMVLYMLLSVSGLVIFKLGVQRQFTVSITNGFFSANIHGFIFLGMVFYICSFLLYMFLISKFDLSYLLPITTGIVYILTFMASIFVLKESVFIYQYIGAALILTGVILVNWRK